MDSVYWIQQKKVLLGTNIDHKSKVDEYVNYLCKKVDQKLNALVRTTTFMDVNKKKSIMKAFFQSQFEYCPLIWIIL